MILPANSGPPSPPDDDDDDAFSIGSFDVQIPCPQCGNELVHDGNTLVLSESPRAVMFECGRCEKISDWQLTWEPFTATSVPVSFGDEP